MTPNAGAAAPDRRAMIVAAATELFALNGFSGTSIDQIGAAAGVTGPAIYRHFTGKDALLHAVASDAIDAFAMSREIVAGALDAMAAHAVAAALDHPDRLLVYQQERPRLQGDARTQLQRRERELVRQWRDAIGVVNPVLPPKEFAQRHRALATALSVTASRSAAGTRPALDRLLVPSLLAVLALPPVPPRAKDDREPLWSLPPSRRERILTAALGLFRRHGFHDVTMDQIGEAAGITGPTIYFHYASKSDMLADAHERASVRTAVGVQDAVRGATSASDALDRLARVQLQVAADDSDLILVTSRETAALDEVDRERVVRRGHEIIDVWMKVVGELRPDIAIPEIRALVLGVFSLINQTAYFLNEPADGVPVIRAWLLGTVE